MSGTERRSCSQHVQGLRRTHLAQTLNGSFDVVKNSPQLHLRAGHAVAVTSSHTSEEAWGGRSRTPGVVVFWMELGVRESKVWVHAVPMVTKVGRGTLRAGRSGMVWGLMDVWMTVALVVHYGSSCVQVSQTGVMRSCGSRGLM